LNPTKRAYFELHIAVLLFGFTAILGDLITLSALVLVWWRMGITTFSIPFLTKIKEKIAVLPPALTVKYMAIGVLVSLHWICFFGAVKFANASISLICMATTSFFTALIEPIILKQKIKKDELSLTITFLELGSGWMFLSICLPIYLMYQPDALFMPQGFDWLWLLILALGCTTLAYVLSLRSLKHISAFASTLTVNLEPVYGIFLAWIFLDDAQELSPQFYFGCLLILGAVFFHSFKNLKTSQHAT